MNEQTKLLLTESQQEIESIMEHLNDLASSENEDRATELLQRYKAMLTDISADLPWTVGQERAKGLL